MNNITNEYVIRNLWTIEQLAEALIVITTEDIYDYNYEEELYLSGRETCCLTSDNKYFYDFEEALEHEIWWLQQEAEEEFDDSQIRF